ncbi:MAG: phosphopantetheine-binding protein [Eubacteriales bacterium]|nr:phosphopantetheine-binding protein [Eubacteriales bacterium]
MSTNMKLKEELLEGILEAVEMEDFDKENYQYDWPLFSSDMEDGDDGMGLDSIDSLELAVLIETKYEIKVKDEDFKILRSIDQVADFIEARKG